MILTAGHNLINPKQQFSQKLTILGRVPGENIDVGNSYEIPDDYKRDPQPSNAVNDYGVILLPRTGNKPRPGFGFSLKLAFINDLEGDVRVTGYRDVTPACRPITSSGSSTCTLDQILYRASTEQGMSGSPVWVSYSGFETVVAIQYAQTSLGMNIANSLILCNSNHAPESIGKGNRGTRLNLKVLLDVFRWANVGWKSKAVKVWDPSAPPQGLYLRFSDYYEEARVRVAADNLETAFDIVPAYTQPTTAKKLPCYVFIFKQPKQRENGPPKWVRWDSSGQKVTLTEKLRDSCLVRIMKQANGAIRIVRAIGTGDKMELKELRMAATRFSLDDFNAGLEREYSEVHFGNYSKGIDKKKPVKV